MGNNAARKQDAGAAAFFVETLCQDADTLLRFGYALTLSEDLAAELVYKTYRSIVPRLPELLKKDGTFIRQQLLRRIWEIHHERVDEGDGSGHALYPLFKGLDLDTRAVLFLFDIVGLTVNEVRDITPMDEVDLRKHLALARTKLMGFQFE